MTDPARRGETSLMLAHAQWGAGSNDDAISVIRQALAAVDLPRMWQARLLALLGQVERQATGFDTADSISRLALTAAEETGDPFATAQALNDLWLIHSVRRDHAAALDNIDQALGSPGRRSRPRGSALDRPGLPHLHAAEPRRMAAGRTGSPASPRVRPANRPHGSRDMGHRSGAAVLARPVG